MVKRILQNPHKFNSINKKEKPLEKEKRVLKDLNPRHLILETSVLPTELRARKLNIN